MIYFRHKLEVSLLEEKLKEEKRLHDIKLAQVSQKLALLEVQLNNHQINKNQLAEQLYSMMQKQWQKALKIIAGEKILELFNNNKLNKIFLIILVF